MLQKKRKSLVLLFVSFTLPLIVLMGWLLCFSARQTSAVSLTAVYPTTPHTDITLTQQVWPNPVLSGETAVYTLQATNASTVTLPVFISNTLPEQVTPTGVLTWTPTISGGDTWQEGVTVTVNAPFGDEITNLLQATIPSSRADNLSYCTTCAEEDNINIPLYGPGVTRFRMVATHPTYEFTTDNCAADFSGCKLTTSAPEDVTCQTLLDDTINVISVCTDDNWWRPYMMTVTVGSNSLAGHWLVWNRKIPDENSWPQVLVYYQDGNMRLKPHPPLGRADVCFGSSVIVGPAVPDVDRPFIDLQTIVVDPAAMALDVTYQNGESAHLEMAVDRDQTQMEVWAVYDTAVSFATFRSMFVAEDNADAARVTTAVADYALLDVSKSDWSVPWTTVSGPSWFFYRPISSTHNTSAPDILIEALDGYVTYTNTLTVPVSQQLFTYLPLLLRAE